MKAAEMKIINQGLEDEMEVWGYRPCLWKRVLVGVGVVCSGGLLLLLLYWLPEWGVKGTCTHTSLREAHTLLLRTTDEFRQWFRAKVHVMLAPGKKPFDDLGLPLPNGDGDLSVGAAQEKFPHRKHTLVPSPLIILATSLDLCFSAHFTRSVKLFFFVFEAKLRKECSSVMGWF
uniref:Cation-transporting ATPase n=1 Tax=Salarias fasciatus TaxID=181472 RepID=A0A672H7C3_SALFA